MKQCLAILTLFLLIMGLNACSAGSTAIDPDADGALRSQALDSKGRLVESTAQYPDGTTVIESFNPDSGLQIKSVRLNPDGSKLIVSNVNGIQKSVHQHFHPGGQKGQKIVFLRNTKGLITEKLVYRPNGTLLTKTVFQRAVQENLQDEILEATTYFFNTRGKLERVERTPGRQVKLTS